MSFNHSPRWCLFIAILSIIIADMSMSADNVLAVATIAQDDTALLVFGLVFSVALMGIAASMISTLMEQYKWIGWLGFFMILYVALKMTWQSGLKLLA